MLLEDAAWLFQPKKLKMLAFYMGWGKLPTMLVRCEHDTVIGTVMVPADYCSGLPQGFDELMGDGKAVQAC